MATLSKADIKMALTRLGELAVSQGTPIRLLMVGGGAMVLAFDARESTRDLDVAILAPQHAAMVRDLAECIARELGWEPTWERITPYLQPGQELKAQYAFEDLWDDAHGQA